MEEAWILDIEGNFLEPIPTSQGVWISHDVMAYVHFLEGSDLPNVQHKSKQTGNDDTYVEPK